MLKHVFVAISLDGYIADAQNGVEWLNAYPQDLGENSAFNVFMGSMDALIMGRNTFEAVHSFQQWPYTIPVWVMSKTLASLPEGYNGKATLCSDNIEVTLKKASEQGFKNLYIDGGRLVQSFLQKDLIDSITLTRIPIILGGGVPLFGELAQTSTFEHIHTQVLEGGLVMSGYARVR